MDGEGGRPIGPGGGLERYVVISADGHDEPPSHLAKFRDYFDPQYRDDFDRWLAAHDDDGMISFLPPGTEVKRYYDDPFRNSMANVFIQGLGNDPAFFDDASERYFPTEPPGMLDPHERLAALESQGVVAELIYPSEVHFQAALGRQSPELGKAARTAYLRWLSAYCTATPGRFAGVIPIEGSNAGVAIKGDESGAGAGKPDLAAMVADIEWGREHGLFGGVVMPTVGADQPPLVDRFWEPLWSVCEDLGLPLVAHDGLFSAPDAKTAYGTDPTCVVTLRWFERSFFSKRTFLHLMAAGVFDRHPKLKLGLVEQQVSTIPAMFHEFDQLFQTPNMSGARKGLKKLPSQYWYDHGFLCAPFLDAREARELRYDIGVANLCWGGDYPHPEGTWPKMRTAMRHALGGLPHAELKAILGGNAAREFGFDLAALQPIADRVGPSRDDLSSPLPETEVPPSSFSYAFAPNRMG